MTGKSDSEKRTPTYLSLSEFIDAAGLPAYVGMRIMRSINRLTDLVPSKDIVPLDADDDPIEVKEFKALFQHRMSVGTGINKAVYRYIQGECLKKEGGTNFIRFTLLPKNFVPESPMEEESTTKGKKR